VVYLVFSSNQASLKCNPEQIRMRGSNLEASEFFNKIIIVDRSLKDSSTRLEMLKQEFLKRSFLGDRHCGEKNNFFYKFLIVKSIQLASNYILSDVLSVFDSEKVEGIEKVVFLRNLLLDEHESPFNDDGDGYLLHLPFDRVFIGSNKEHTVWMNRWKLWYFQKLLACYKKYRVEDELGADKKGPTGLPLDAAMSTPLAYAWLQDYLQITKDQDDSQYDWETGLSLSDKIRGARFFEAQDDFQNSLTSQIVDILSVFGISKAAMRTELNKAFRFARRKEDVSTNPVATMQQKFREYIQNKLG